MIEWIDFRERHPGCNGLYLCWTLGGSIRVLRWGHAQIMFYNQFALNNPVVAPEYWAEINLPDEVEKNINLLMEKVDEAVGQSTKESPMAEERLCKDCQWSEHYPGLRNWPFTASEMIALKTLLGKFHQTNKG